MARAARRRRPDVAMNPQTWDKESPRSMSAAICSTTRHGRCAVEIPRRRQCHRHAADRHLQPDYSDPRQRQLFKNIIYVGALASLLDIDIKVIEGLITEQFKGKDDCSIRLQGAAFGPRLRERASGEDLQALGAQIGPRGQPHLHRGQRRGGAGAVYGGATVCAWYPITPSTSMAEAFTAHCASCASIPSRRKTNSQSFRRKTSSPRSAR